MCQEDRSEIQADTIGLESLQFTACRHTRDGGVPGPEIKNENAAADVNKSGCKEKESYEDSSEIMCARLVVTRGPCIVTQYVPRTGSTRTKALRSFCVIARETVDPKRKEPSAFGTIIQYYLFAIFLFI